MTSCVTSDQTNDTISFLHNPMQQSVSVLTQFSRWSSPCYSNPSILFLLQARIRQSIVQLATESSHINHQYQRPQCCCTMSQHRDRSSWWHNSKWGMQKYIDPLDPFCRLSEPTSAKHSESFQIAEVQSQVLILFKFELTKVRNCSGSFFYCEETKFDQLIHDKRINNSIKFGSEVFVMINPTDRFTQIQNLSAISMSSL